MGRGGEGLEAGRMPMPLCLLGFRGCGGGGEMDEQTATDDLEFRRGGPGGRSLVGVRGFVGLWFCGPLWIAISVRMS